MFWTCSFQVGCDWEQVVAAQVFSPSLERDVCRSSERGVLSLVGRARTASIERALRLVLDLRAAFLGSSELVFARASLSYFSRQQRGKRSFFSLFHS